MTQPPASQSPLTAVLVLVAAVALGLFALPRLGRSDEDALVGSQPRDLSLPRLQAAGGGADGEKPVKLSELAGKAVLLEFWASWCGPCREQGPIVDRVASDLAARGLVALGVVSGDEPAAALRFLEKHPVRYASVVDDQRDAARAFGVDSLPTLVALDRSGRVVAVRRGLVPERELREVAEAALAH
jgi:thiol-disulfide isomerase/thioredoxin